MRQWRRPRGCCGSRTGMSITRIPRPAPMPNGLAETGSSYNHAFFCTGRDMSGWFGSRGFRARANPPSRQPSQERLRASGQATVLPDGDELREVFGAATVSASNHGREARLALTMQYATYAASLPPSTTSPTSTGYTAGMKPPSARHALQSSRCHSRYKGCTPSSISAANDRAANTPPHEFG